jgi:hypothetical protein
LSDPVIWVRDHDPDLLAIKRSIRAAVVMPLVFGLTELLFSNAQIALFGAFGSFALLLLVDFPGRPRTRLLSYLGLFVAGSCFTALGTFVSTHKVLAVAAMAVVGFVVLFAGILAPQAATASTASLLTFVLPVAVAQPVSAIGPRLVGWALAGVICIPACMWVWPTPWHDDLRRRLSATLSAISRLASAHAEGRHEPETLAAVHAELTSLRDQFAGTAYPPTGAAAAAVALAKLVGRTEWVAGNATVGGDEAVALQLDPVRSLFGSVADTLRRSASLICDGDGHPVDDPDIVAGLQKSVRSLDQLIGTELDMEVSKLISSGTDGDDAGVAGLTQSELFSHDGGIAVSLDPSFHARSLVWPQRSSSAAGFSRTSPCTRCGSGTPCAVRPGWPWRWPSWRSPTSNMDFGWCWAPSRCSGPMPWAPVPPPSAPWAGRRWALWWARPS